MKNIVLIGISGSGKTTMGKALAKGLSREFIDLDSLIVKRENQDIESIFSKRGEAGFREAESEAIKSISKKKNSIIACGGGAVLKEENMNMLTQNGIVVFMNRPLSDILNTVNLSDRPLLRGNPRKLLDIFEKRKVLYEKYADFQVKEKAEDETLRMLQHISTLPGKAMRLAVIGDPIGHSLSPPIHIAALKPLLKNITYEKNQVKKNMLAQWLNVKGREKLDGFNVTMPHKEDIISLLDYIDEEARLIGSVNTVVNRGGKLWGYNTDGDGFFRALKNSGRSICGLTVTIIGSGGAAITVAMKAAREGADALHLVARNGEAADRISHKVEEIYKTKCYKYGLPIHDNNLDPWQSDVIVNATPLGMAGTGNEFKDLAFVDKINRKATIFDLIYNPMRTKLMIAAENAGMKTVGGLEMLIEQALEADNRYLGAELISYRARKRVVDILEKEVEKLW